MTDASNLVTPPVSAKRSIDQAASLINAARAGQSPDTAREAAKGFEAVFLSQIVDAMFTGVDTDGYFGGGSAEKMWRGFLVEHIADAFAERGGVGIADAVLGQIIQLSERQDVDTP